MKVSRPIVALAIATLLLLVVFGLWPRSTEKGARPGNGANAEAAAGEPASPAPEGTSAGEVEDFPPLPPEDMPIDQAAPLLAAHARRGHAGAACRLALELLTCRSALGQDGLRGLQYYSAEQEAAKGNLDAAIRIDQQTLAIAERASACRGVEPALHEDAVRLLSQAARAGVPYAMYLYATGEHYRYRDIGFAATPEFDQWRRSAPGMMLAARDAGIPEAAAFLAQAYSQDVGLASALFPDDPVQANAHWQLQSLLRSGTTTRPFAFMFDRLESAQERESLDLARRWHEEAFAGGVFPNLSHSDMPYFPGTHGSMTSSDCQGPAPRVSMAAPRQAGD